MPEWRPATTNAGRGRHWRASERAAKEAADMLATYAAIAGVRRVSEDYRPKRHVAITVYVSVGGEPDPDNVLKYTLDGLKRASLIVDDSRAWCDWSKPVVERVAGRRSERFEVVIRDVQPEHADKPVKVARRELVVKCHVNLETGKPFAERNVYLVQLGSGDGEGARSLDLYDVDVTIFKARDLAAWARSLSIPVVEEPPGCLADGFEWPEGGWGGIKPLPKASAPVYTPSDIF